MTAAQFGQLVGGTIGSVLGLVFVFCLMVAMFGWPLLALSAVRSLRKIARELERANDYREHYEHGKKPTPIGL